ncbi:MAG: rhodanese-like domain-containing protein [Acidobacteriota bacterium]
MRQNSAAELSPASRIALLLLSSISLAWASNRLAGRQRRLAWSAGGGSLPAVRTSPAAEANKPSSVAAPWTEISGEEAARFFAAKAVFFDARRTAAYREGHIREARSLPVWEDIDEKLKSLVAEGLDPSAPVVVYCSGGDCEDSHLLGERLKTELPRMLNEHKLIVVALQNLLRAATKEGHAGYARFAQKLILHAQMEEEILYAASIIVGEYLKWKLESAGPEEESEG